MLEAWQRYDHACERWSRSKEKATTETLRLVTDRMVETSTEYAAELGITQRWFRELLLIWRRFGHNHERACLAVEAGLRV